MKAALLLSGGTGSRMHTDIPKQYIRVAGKMVITYSLETIVNASVIERIYIVAAKEWHEEIIADAKRHGICTDKIVDFAIPGISRQSSILNGLRCIVGKQSADIENDEISDADTVLVHDAARPRLTEAQINACVTVLDGHDGVLPVLPMKDTIYLSKNGRQVTELLDRSALFAGQAPELFYLKKYYQANLMLLPARIDRINGSTEPAILAGMDIIMIPGDEGNFKITTNADMERFQELCGMEVKSL